MTPRYDRFLIILCLLYVVGSCHAVYDPSATTVKPPKRREPVLPWYLSGKDYPEPAEDADLSRSPKWQTDPDEPRKPIIVNAGTKTWTPWRRTPGSEIEQRTEVDDDRQSKLRVDQTRDWPREFGEFEQPEDRKLPGKPSAFESFEQKQDRHLKKEDEPSTKRPEDCKPQPESDRNFYEGLPIDNTKSHKEKILLSTRPKSKVAQYDPRRGVVCPEVDSTGQFVYPPDCKFFVNCWKGRAFVQPCAPGTLFNPDTLECDFPHKVKCYGGEIADFPSKDHLDFSGGREPLQSASQVHPGSDRLQSLPPAPRCPPHVTGMLPHPTDCTKFLQCANGGTIVMDCGPGTVFNPSISVCDWPRNVRGCEDAFKMDEENSNKPPVPPSPYEHKTSQYNEPRQYQKVSCPSDYTGLLPHPETCKKFLQCANGITYIMDCGPGTAFNPLTSVCDWPYNVPGCSEDKPALNQVPPTTTARPWPSRDQTGSTPWYNSHRHNQTSSGHRGPPNWSLGQPTNFPTTTSTPEIDWNSRLRPTWKPTWKPNAWTTARPSYTQGHYENSHPPHDHHDHYSHGSVYNSNDNRQTGRPGSYGYQHSQGDHEDGTQETMKETWAPTPDYHHASNHGHRDDSQDNKFGYPTNPSASRIPEGNVPPNRRTGQEFIPNRQEYGRNGPVYDRTPAPDGNIYVESDYDLRKVEAQDVNGNRMVPVWPARNRTVWTGPAGQGQAQPPTGSQTQPWSQGVISEDDKLREWQSRTNIYQQTTTDNEADRKLDQWASKTNIFQYAKGQVRPGSKDRLLNTTSPSPPSNIYVNINGTRGHLITKEIEVNQGHSKTRNYGPNDVQEPSNSSRTFDAFRPRNESRTDRAFNFSSWQPSVELEPPYYNPVNLTQGPAVNFTGTNPFLSPKYHSTNGQPTPADSIGADSNYPHILLPSNQSPNNNVTNHQNVTNLYMSNSHAIKPNFPLNRSKNLTVPNNHYLVFLFGRPLYLPNVTVAKPVDTSYQITLPSTNLQPPSYGPLPIFMNDSSHDYKPPLLPSTNLQPPYYQPFRPSYSPSNFYNSAGTDIHRAFAPPVMNQQLPYYQHNRPLDPRDYTGSPNANGFYPNVPAPNLQPPYYPFPPYSPVVPNVPASDLQPPHYQPPTPPWVTQNITSPESTPSHYPNVPATDLLPPYYEQTIEPPSRMGPYPEVPAIDLQPPFYEQSSRSFATTNATTSPDIDIRFPIVPSADIQPPYYQSTKPPQSTTHLSFSPKNYTSYPEVPATDLQPPYYEPAVATTLAGTEYPLVPNTTERAKVDKHTEAPVKKKVLQPPKEVVTRVVTRRMDPNVPSVSIEYSSGEFAEPVEPELDVDVLDEKEVWKPLLVFENKTRTTTTTESSVIMKINKKKIDVDLFNIEAAPFHQEEPPFPAYYIPPVQPLSHSRKAALPTPISGQVIRLRGGSGPGDGYVEVQGANPGWGIVCDSRNSWTLKEAHVVCKQLGYARGAEMAWQGRNTRDGVPTWIAANTVTCYGNETRFQSCKFTHKQECRVERDAIGVRCVPNRIAHCRDDEIPHEGQCYHLADPESGLNHTEALQYCGQRQSRLIDITSQPENDFISEWLLQKHPEIGSVMTSGVGFTTLNRTLWLWEDSSRAKFKFAKWWPGWMQDKKLPPRVGSRPACVVMKRKYPCHERPDSICVVDYFFWDTEDCAASMKGHSYICKRPYDDIGCIYGKGSQYSGNASVTASGKHCLPWSDPKVAHPLVVNVVNREVRDKLKLHNYCRNPNPNKETRPWCFTGANGEREYCDIPACGNIGTKKSLLTGQCKPKHFECLPGECIPSTWVCDGEEDCTNGADERSCKSHLSLFQKSARQKLEGYDVEKWLNTPLKTCALRCKEADFTCRSFAHKAVGNICLLSDSNVGMTGALKPNREFDYYEMKERSMNCDGMYVCGNRKCINQTEVCNGKNDCNDRTDESICTVENLDYAIRLAGSNNSHEGRVEVKILGVWGQVCDDGFGMNDAEVICKELGFPLGALEVRPGGFYGNLEPPTRFMVDQLKCRGNETTLRECDFDGWGVHNCQPEEAVGVVCKTAVDSCQEGHWKCDNSPVCIPTPFICDEVVDCPDGSDESPSHCNAPFEIRLVNGSSPLQGRVEVRHHGVWGTVCDDDFSNATATVICRSLGYGGRAIAKKDGYFGPGEGPIWLDEVFCHGNETQLYRCEHNHWGQNNCDHNEDAGVICSPGEVNDSEVNRNTLFRRRA